MRTHIIYTTAKQKKVMEKISTSEYVKRLLC